MTSTPPSKHPSGGPGIRVWVVGGGGAVIGVLLLVLAAILYVHADESAIRKIVSILLGDLGSVIVSLCLLHLAYEHGLWKEQENRVRRVVSAIVERLRDDPKFIRNISTAAQEAFGKVQALKELGVDTIHRRLSEDQVIERIQHASTVRVLKTWFPDEAIERELHRLVQDGRAFELIMSVPDSPILEARSQGVEKQSSHGAEKVRVFLEHILGWLKQAAASSAGDKARVTVYLYKGWPGAPVIWYDDTILLGFYFCQHSSPAWPWLEIHADSEFGRIVQEQFVWFRKNASHSANDLRGFENLCRGVGIL